MLTVTDVAGYSMADAGLAAWPDRGIISLMALLRFYAEKFCRISGAVGQAIAYLKVYGGLDQNQLSALGSHLGELRRSLPEVGLQITSRKLDRLLAMFEAPSTLQWQAIEQQLADILVSIGDEMETRLLLFIPANRVELYSGHDLFGPEVSRKFPNAARDIAEAGKCVALGRNAAAVFHLMRVMEAALRSIARSLTDPSLDPARNPSWENILKKCDRELAKPIAERSAQWRSNDAFFSTAIANLRAVKNAWRNPTMHVEKTYSDEEALEIWNAVKGFVRHIATKLDEEA
jgi:hypothetical protein